ncbi:hypothetical protein NC652_031224 [Populus alba x Populus x berolinensis]|nr:hypothetical protein NC652_031224 [Populus alba x Populus x berolinensis]
MAQQQSSRLNRLLTLLDTGSTQATRLTAAKQIGDIAKSHPQDLHSLLKKVSQNLHSKNWDTRVAAAHAIGAIAQNVKHASLNELFASVETKMSEIGVSGHVEDLVACPNFHSQIISNGLFRSFDMNKVLEFGALLASGGQEYDIANDNSKNPRERLARQKQNLRRRLGLDVCEQFMDVNDVIKDEDLVVHRPESQRNGLDHRFYKHPSVHNIQQLVASMTFAKPKGMSKISFKLANLKPHADADEEDNLEPMIGGGRIDIVVPLSHSSLCENFFGSLGGSPVAVSMALREIVNYAKLISLGCVKMDPNLTLMMHLILLKELSWHGRVKVLETMYLTRWLAPVRHNCAQALGAAFKYMHQSLVYETFEYSASLQRRPEWEIRLRKLLGITYLVAVRKG